MIPRVSQIGFGAIKGVAKLHHDDKNEIPIDVPDKVSLVVSKDHGKMRLSSDPSKAYAMVQIHTVDNDSHLKLSGNAKIDVNTVKNQGILSLYEDAVANINKAQKGSIINQYDNSRLTAKAMYKSQLTASGKSVAEINYLTSSNISLNDDSLMSVDQMHVMPEAKGTINQLNNSRSIIKTTTSMLKPEDKIGLAILPMISMYNNATTEIGNLKDTILYQGNNSTSSINIAEADSHLSLHDQARTHIKRADSGSIIKKNDKSKVEIEEDKRGWLDKIFS
ncbi:MAG: hypothetical protein ACD_20C00343G0001 [uncultured bacterium]|nr:MAG: hypothetical protein ACD_20C00343G0001 [uncultured bacterium]HBH17740.1 hypothetical protein [Cyanobacteria bacterium UBA9579]